ncbi:unnamed protein product [Trichobilharzia regenti]|nr:unnamed protein product [Trichobilharzia regenti]
MRSGVVIMNKSGYKSKMMSILDDKSKFSRYPSSEDIHLLQGAVTANLQTSNRQLHDSRSVGSRAVLEEMETITLQPIGRGVHDLEPPAGSIARSVRANTPTGRSSSYIVPISRPHSSAARIHPVSAERTKQSSYKEYYSSPIRLKRSTIDLPYSSTVTQALISPPTSRRYVDFTCASQTTTHVSSMNRGLQHQHPPVPLPPPHTNNITHLINKWNSNSNNSQKNSTGGLNLPKVNTNSYARQTLTQNIQEITQKQQNRQHSPNQHHRISMNHNELGK